MASTATTATNFGTDIACTDGLRTGQYSSGLRLVGEALYRRFRTPRGTLRGGEEEQNYGLDLLDLIGSVARPNDVAALQGKIQAEALKDSRILTASAAILSNVDGPSTTYQITISVTTDQGPFDLVIAASAVSVDLLGIVFP